ncbi:venom allergen 5-like [Diorhabda carinulata]|uniref:venom allergen 5-like n=1 Tax=Diorhabda carinulata TaxID=1163345 RepID=UPI0025A2BEC6|nr:venom allergen 5-like [Diorhabda carinulata]
MLDIKILSILSITLKIFHDTNGDCTWPSCGNEENVVCRHGGNCDPKESDCEPVPFTNQQRNKLLSMHNEYRNDVAGGKDNRGGASEAANIMVLNYDFDLEYVASCTANTCKMEHESCRKTNKFSSVGQNLYMGGSLMNSVKKWYGEIVLMTAENFDNLKDFSGVGHFTQIVWAETTHVGCAAARKGNTYLVACNYGPAGNLIGSKVYIKGNPASKCPDGTQYSRVYRALCGVAYKLTPTGKDFVEMSQGFRSHETIGLIYLFVCVLFILI